VKVFIENFYKVVNSLEVRQVVVCYIDADAEVEACVSSVDDFEVTELQPTQERRLLKC